MEYTFYTNINIEDCLLRLNESILTCSTFNYSTLALEKTVYGSVKGNRFNLRKIPEPKIGARLGMMHFKGEFRQKNQGTEITGHFDIDLSAKVFAVIFVLPFLFVLLLGLLNLVLGNDIELRSILPFAFPPVVMIAVYLFWYRMQEPDQPVIIDFIKTTFEATPITPERKQN